MLERKNYIDWLRVAAVVLLFDYHSAQIFSHFGCYVKDTELSNVLSIFQQFVFQWHMHLLFILAGMSSYYALQKRDARVYVKERFFRLFIPFIFGTLVIVPPLNYLLNLSSPTYYGSYLKYLYNVEAFLTANGDLHWAHLWFLVYLIIYSAACLPLFILLKKENVFISFISSICEKFGCIFLFALPFCLIEAVFRPGWPGGMFNIHDDWATFFLYFGFFVFGFVLCTNEKFLHAVDRHLIFFIALAIIFMAGYFGLIGAGFINEYKDSAYTPSYMGFQFFRGFNSWLWVMSIVGLGRKYMDFGGNFLEYCKNASYPVYILHATIIMLIGYQVVKLEIGALPKFLIVDFSAFFVTMIVYEIFVRRTKMTRFLLGMKN
jgi:Acyltransferase family